ncbi:type II toxin-antitoxin system RelE/ParE family toxin [Glycocaulis sp.]
MNITRRAQTDLANIWAYIAQDSVSAADQLVDGIEAALKSFLDYPEAGTPRFHLAPGLRAVIHGNYVAYYVHDDTSLTLLRVAHARSDQAAMFPQN